MVRAVLALCYTALMVRAVIALLCCALAGASLELLEGKVLPGIAALDDKNFAPPPKPVEASGDFKVADMSLSDFGRKEYDLAEFEMPGLMAARKEFGPSQPLAGVRVAGYL